MLSDADIFPVVTPAISELKHDAGSSQPPSDGGRSNVITASIERLTDVIKKYNASKLTYHDLTNYEFSWSIWLGAVWIYMAIYLGTSLPETFTSFVLFTGILSSLWLSIASFIYNRIVEYDHRFSTITNNDPLSVYVKALYTNPCCQRRTDDLVYYRNMFKHGAVSGSIALPRPPYDRVLLDDVYDTLTANKAFQNASEQARTEAVCQRYLYDLIDGKRKANEKTHWIEKLLF